MCLPLSAEEYRLQPMDDVSPPWWNLGHTSWFFARNVLAAFGGRRLPSDADYEYLLNSYYEAVGERLPRSQRGSLSRPTNDEIYDYRASIDGRVVELLESIDEERLTDLLNILEIGIQHEQQHQELFYTEIKFIRYQNPPSLRAPYFQYGTASGRRCGSYRQQQQPPGTVASPTTFIRYAGGLHEFGDLEGGWSWDNELPIHKYYLEPFELADRLVTNAEYLEFIDDGGYKNPLLWLDNGWQHVKCQGWHAPLYWDFDGHEWLTWTLHGTTPLNLEEPVGHVSFYEADAFTRWRAATYPNEGQVRMPSEREWEQAARFGDIVDDTANAFMDSGSLRPAPADTASGLKQLAGHLWQWTSSYYEPYPGYEPFPGVLAEYNGKFMDNQRVLRGGSYVTPREHYRLSYRNFWPAATRFQFTGIRLARS
jgi:ergothioneine biosynthesis protein EgtB